MSGEIFACFQIISEKIFRYTKPLLSINILQVKLGGDLRWMQKDMN